MLTEFLKKRNVTCVAADGDADSLIVKTAIQQSKICDTVLVGEDTDLLILLLHHATTSGHELCLFNQGKRGSPGKWWNIKLIMENLAPQTCRSLLFVHAILGCDTTRIHGIGKSVALKKAISNHEDFLRVANIFMKASASKEEI